MLHSERKKGWVTRHQYIPPWIRQFFKAQLVKQTSTGPNELDEGIRWNKEQMVPVKDLGLTRHSLYLLESEKEVKKKCRQWLSILNLSQVLQTIRSPLGQFNCPEIKTERLRPTPRVLSRAPRSSPPRALTLNFRQQLGLWESSSSVAHRPACTTS